MVRPVALFLRQFPDSVTHNERRGLAVVPHHKVSVRHLTMPHLWAERRIDSAVRTVWLRIAVLGIDLLNPRASQPMMIVILTWSHHWERRCHTSDTISNLRRIID
jgi:hypothetical protein